VFANFITMMQKSPSSAPPPAPLKKKFKLTFSVSALNTFLFLGILACLIALGLEMRSGFSLLHQDVEFPREPKTGASLPDTALPSTPSVDYYLQKINERNIFKPYVPKTAAKKAAG